MKKYLLGVGLSVAAALAAPTATAQQTVVVNGVTYICPNQCVITISGNHISARDSLGGQITIIYPPPPPRPEPQ